MLLADPSPDVSVAGSMAEEFAEMLWEQADSSGDEQQDGEQTEPEQVRKEKKRIKPERVVVVVAKAGSSDLH